MFNDSQSHRILLLGIMGSLAFTIFVSTLAFDQISSIGSNVDKLLEDVGYIKGVISSMNGN